MEKAKWTKEFDDEFNKTISEKLIRHTVQFFIKDRSSFKPYGSGVLAKIHDEHFIFTASHVTEILYEGKSDLYLKVGEDSYVNVIGNIHSSIGEKSDGLDIAYIKLDEQLIAPLSKPYIFIETTQIRNHNVMLDGLHYCVVGYPENFVREKEGKFQTGGAVYLTTPAKPNVYSHYKYDKEEWFIVNMSGKGEDLKTGLPTKVDKHFYGLSGCGLWFISYTQDAETLKVLVEYKLIGIMTEFKNGKYFCLVGNKIKFMMRALEVIEKFKFK